MDGEWTEKDSYEKIKKYVKETKAKVPDEATYKRMRLEEENFNKIMKRLRNPDQFYEKEYYFDEGLGVSVMEHIEQIKANHPDVEVQTRRDRDGFAIIKTRYKPKYKYNLDDIVGNNPIEER